MNYIKNKIILIILLIFSVSGCAQIGKQDKMKKVTMEFITYFKNCDTLSILKLLDSSFTKINKQNHRVFIATSILRDCSLFNTIVKQQGMPDLSKIVFKKDSSRIPGANIMILPLIDRTDSSLNLKNYSLVLIFKPDEYLNIDSRLLRFSISKEVLRVVDRDKVEMPDWLKELNKTTPQSDSGLKQQK